MQIGGVALNAWNGFGLGNEFQEWDSSAAYSVALEALGAMDQENIFRVNAGLSFAY